MRKLAIVIVNYCSAGVTLDCLASLAADGYSRTHARVIVGDNASPDGSGRMLREAVAARGWGAWVTLMESRTNGGFAAGNNVALREVLATDPPEYVLLLNPDTVVYPKTVESLQGFLDDHSRA